MATINTLPAGYNIVATRGDMIYLTWEKRLLTDALYDWPGRLIAQFKRKQTDPNAVFTLDSDAGTIVKQSNYIEWIHRTSVADTVQEGVYYYDMQEVLGNGDIITHINGLLSINQDVTRGAAAVINVNGFGQFPIYFT